MGDRALIVGAGVSGLTAAIGFARIGEPPEVVELKTRWEPVSSGIFLQSNGLAMLRRLGVLSEILTSGFAVRDAMAVFTWRGDAITSVQYPRLAGADTPATVGIKRSMLHEVLANAAREAGVQVRLGTSVASLKAADGGTLAETSDGVRRVYRLVIGADGIHSAVRRLVFPDRPPASESDFGVWRCFAPRPADLDEKIMLIGPGSRLGIMPVSQDELYLFGITREPAGSRLEQAEWPAAMRERFGAFRGPAPALLEAASGFHYARVEEVPAEPSWTAGTVVLIGDAAHAMTPFMGQGASIAMEDSVVLAELVAEAESGGPGGRDGMAVALERFEARRRPRVEFVQDRSLAAGRAWGSDAEAFSPEQLRRTMQARVNEFYAVLAGTP